MEVTFLYHSSTSEQCIEIINKVLPKERKEILLSDDISPMNAQYFLRKYSLQTKSNNIFFVFFSASAVLSDPFMKKVDSLTVEQSRERNFSLKPIMLDDCNLPVYLLRLDILYARADSFIRTINDIISPSNNQFHNTRIVNEDREIYNHQSNVVNELKECYQKGDLVLFCGAGTSFDNSIPTWKDLIYRIFLKFFSIQNAQNISSDDFYNYISNTLGLSLPVLARYLKNELKENFDTQVKEALYTNINYFSNPLVDSIVSLCKPKYKEHGGIESIITTNFDDVLEQNFAKRDVHALPVYNGELSVKHALPIFHVHGYLPNKPSPEDTELVFSEDAYHDQFYSPYKWQNLVQLNAFINSSCLFIGVGFTDPNLRRLLDMSRKQSGSVKQHYIFDLRRSIDDFSDKSGLSSADTGIFISSFYRMQEEDAKALGLKYILVENYSEIPDILNQISGNEE